MKKQSINNFKGLLLILITTQLFSSCSMIFHNRRDAYHHMGKIKETTVLVRLRSNENKIEKLRATGNNEQADKLKAKSKKQNNEIIQAVKEHYHFSNYYFIQAEMMHMLEDENYTKLEIIDKNLDLVKDPAFLSEGYYVFSFDGVYETQFIQEDDSGKRSAYGGTDSYVGVAILDSELIQLAKPFPKIGLPEYKKNVKKSKLVSDYNDQLNRFYDFNYKRIKKFYKPMDQ